MNVPGAVRQRKRGYEFGSLLPQVVTSEGDAVSHQGRPSDCRILVQKVLSFLLLLLSLLTIYLLVSTSPINPQFIKWLPPPKFIGPLEQNKRLHRATHKFQGELLGPESIAFDPTGKYIYTGTADGRIMEIHGGQVRELTRLGTEPCGTYENEPTCGRPLGMTFDRAGFLIVLDAYLGIFQINVVTGDKTLLASAKSLESTFLNDLAIDHSGQIYFTDSSATWSRRDVVYSFMEGKPTGRFMHYNPNTKRATTLMSNSSFPNGVALSYRGDFILICELGLARILRYWLKGQRKGQMEVFADNLPGFPDNIRSSGRGTYWVAMSGARLPDKFSFLEFAASRPWLRKLVTKFVGQHTIRKLLPTYGLIIELDKNGDIIQSLHDPSGEVIAAVSEVAEKDGILYLGSYYAPHLSILNLHQENKHL